MADRGTPDWHPAGRLARRNGVQDVDERSGRVLGSVRLDPAAVVLQANSVERAERGRGWLAEVLGSLVGPALTALQTPEQAMAEKAA